MAAHDSQSKPDKSIFPKLPSGPQKTSRAGVARHQRARLLGAMVEAVSRVGYASVTVSELAALAGVSKSAFYEHFDNKQECFLAAFDEIMSASRNRVGEAFRAGGDFRERLTASLTDFMDLVATEPKAASLTAVDSLSLGAAGFAHRQRAAGPFETLIRQSFEHSPATHPVSDTTIRAVVAGIRGVVYRHLRAGRQEELPGVVEDLVAWALSYQKPDPPRTERAIAAAARIVAQSPEEPGDAPGRPGWDESPASKRSRTSLDQRERIMRAAARMAVARGYHALSIPAISGAAGVSNQTFYEYFDGKRDAFIAAFEALATPALTATAEAFEREESRAEAIGAGLATVLRCIADDELLARVAFFELPAAGPAALDRAEAMTDGFATFLTTAVRSNAIAEPPSQTAVVATQSGVWSVIQYEIALGRRESLSEMAPELIRVVTVP